MEITCDAALIALAGRNFTYREISAFLWKSHEVELSPNAIGKRLKSLGVPSRKGQTIHEQAAVRRVIEFMLPDLPETVGYRCLTNKLRQNGINVRRDTIMKLLKEIDPAGADFRRRRRINRRVYRSRGPNHVWHVDGYDKLKPYGFAIHGCIDGYSRKILWLTAGPSNNDPAIMALNFVTCVERNRGCPLILQTDPGTENTIMGALQCVFRYDSDDLFRGINSYHVTRSVFNQRIESWWSMLRRRQSQWWMTFLKDLEEHGIFHRGNETEKSAVSPGGRPDVLYSLCEETGGTDCLTNVSETDVEWAKTISRESSRSGSVEFDLQAKAIFDDNNMSDAFSWHDALQNYGLLLLKMNFRV